MRELAGKVVFISGGAGGLGGGMAEAFREAGARVAVADINLDAARKAAAALTAAGGLAVAVALDVGDRSSWEAAAQTVEGTLGPVQVLCNNAGVAGISRTVAEIPLDEWRWQAETNVYGVVNGLQCFLPRLKTQAEAHIVNTSSIGGVSAIPRFGDYISSKFAVVGLTNTLRLELAGTNIGVSALCPSAVKSGLGDNTVRLKPSRAAFAADRAAATAKWRYIEPIEAGRIVVRGVRENWPYIFTHPEDRALLEARYAEMMAAFDKLGAPPK